MSKRSVAVVITASCPHVDTQVITTGRIYNGYKHYWPYDTETALIAMELCDTWASDYAVVTVTIVRKGKTYTRTMHNDYMMIERIKELYEVAWGLKEPEWYGVNQQVR